MGRVPLVMGPPYMLNNNSYIWDHMIMLMSNNRVPRNPLWLLPFSHIFPIEIAFCGYPLFFSCKSLRSHAVLSHVDHVDVSMATGSTLLLPHGARGCNICDGPVKSSAMAPYMKSM